MRILLVETDEALRDVIAGELGAAGHVVYLASDEVTGWTRLSEANPRPDVIVIDTTMPNMEGHRLRIRQLSDPAFASIPVVVLRSNESSAPALWDAVAIEKRTHLVALLAAVLEAATLTQRLTKDCDCGRSHDIASWRALLGVGELDNGRDLGEVYELRQCVCGSTLAWEVGLHAISIPPDG